MITGKKFSFNFNDNCVNAWCRSLFITDGNAYLNCKHRHQFSKGITKILSDPTRAHSLLDHSKDRKRASKRRFNDYEFHVQERKYVSQISVKISFATTQLPAL